MLFRAVCCCVFELCCLMLCVVRWVAFGRWMLVDDVWRCLMLCDGWWNLFVVCVLSVVCCVMWVVLCCVKRVVCCVLMVVDV